MATILSLAFINVYMFYRWIKASKWQRRNEEGLAWNTAAIFRENQRKTNEKLMPFTYKQRIRRGSTGQLYLLAVIRSGSRENETLWFEILYFLIFHGIGQWTCASIQRAPAACLDFVQECGTSRCKEAAGLWFNPSAGWCDTDVTTCGMWDWTKSMQELKYNGELFHSPKYNIQMRTESTQWNKTNLHRSTCAQVVLTSKPAREWRGTWFQFLYMKTIEEIQLFRRWV